MCADKPTFEQLQQQNEELNRRIDYLTERLVECGKSEMELKDRFRKNRELIERMPALVLETDLDGNVTYANPAAKRLLGYRDDVNKTNIFSLSPDNEREHWQESFSLGVKGGKGVVQTTIFDSEGKQRHLLVISRPIKVDGDETGLAMFGIEITDIRHAQAEMMTQREALEGVVTERTADLQKFIEELQDEISSRKQIEKSLVESWRQYSSTIDAMADMIHMIGRDYKIVFINESFRKMLPEFGLSGEATGKSVFEVFPFLGEEVKAQYDQVFSTGKRLVSEEVNVLNGKTIITETRKIPVMEDNVVERIVTVVRDITNRRLAEIRIRESEERYRLLAETAEDMIFIIDNRDTVLYVNSFAAKQVGLPPEEIVGKPRKQFFTMDISDRQKGNIGKVFTEGKPVHVEHHTEFKNCEMWLDTQLVPIRNAEGKITSVLGISRDTTERKRLDQAKINFLGSISHELRTPLSLILGYSEMLLKEDLPAPVKKKLGVIHERGRQELKLVEELITLAAFEKGITLYAMSETFIERFLDKYLAEAKMMIGNLVEKRFRTFDFSFEKKISKELSGVIVKIDEQRMKQVLDNLIENAVKYSKKERLEYSVTAEIRGEDVVIGVADKGIGIPEEEKDDIFKPFYQIRKGAHPVSDGIGKGLSIVQELVEAHEGSVWLDSKLDEGSVFYFSIPIVRIEAVEPKKEKVRKILVVDDDQDLADMMENLLSSEGFETEVANDGRTALDKTALLKPDLILLDIHLKREPGELDGLDVCREIKKNGGLSKTMIYLFSAKTREQLRFLCSNCQADGFFTKPIEMNEILETINGLRV